MSAAVKIREGFSSIRGYQTWFRITGDLQSGKVPVVIAHGGPGCTHDYVDAFKDLADSGRAVIHYDQLGNGKSTHLPEAPADFWTVQLFLDELEALVNHLGIAENYNLLGHSWGGMLAAEHAVLQPAGLNAAIIASSPSSFPVWVSEALRLRSLLPQPVQDELNRYEALEDYNHPDYLAATEVFYRQHVCRLDVWPQEVERTFAAIAHDPTVYHTMNGPTEFHVIGTLKNWSIDNRLHQVKAPVLVLSGKYDEATAACVAPFVANIPQVEQVIMPQSSHMSHVEEREATMAVVEAYLARFDG
ncbi:proline iminopeptidase-family hydrolase [Brucellaceae bacterium C25G]